MSEENEGSEAGTNGAAIALALQGASREEADTFLREQTEVSRLLKARIKTQDDHLHEEECLKLSHLRIRRFGDYAKMALEISIGLLVLALVAGISLMVWNARHSEGLIIESFSVPPSLADKGVTGQVIAAQVLDKLTVMQTETSSARPVKSYTNNWGDDLKVEIPDTGMSVGELYRFLRRWLGNETHKLANFLYRVCQPFWVALGGNHGRTLGRTGRWRWSGWLMRVEGDLLKHVQCLSQCLKQPGYPRVARFHLCDLKLSQSSHLAPGV